MAERAAIGGSIGLAAYLLAAELLGLPRPDILLVAVCAAAFACGRYAPALSGGACTAAILAAGLPEGGTAVPLILATAAPWLAGSALRTRSQALGALRRRTSELEAEQDALAGLSVERERARIARELHDIVAHHLAVIVVQAGAGRVATAEEPEAAERFARIRSSGEQALADMERLVGLLDPEREASEGRPSIEVLVDQAQAAGLRMNTSPLPPDLALSPEVEQVAYRIVQEGLTNAIKHAPGSEMTLRVAAGGGELEIELWNAGGQGSSSLAQAGSGLGLRGLRERVSELGGSLEAGPRGGGWRLAAAIPLA